MTERRKQRISVLLPILACLGFAAILSAFWLSLSQNAAFEQLSDFTRILVEASPESETQVLSAVKQYQESPRAAAGEPFLAQYGYKSSSFFRGWDRAAGLMPSVLFFGAACCFLASEIYREKQCQRRILELTGYLEQVNSGLWGTIVQQKEDEFSKLQDQIYKTVTQLRLTKEAAIRAKLDFADNLTNIAHQLKTPVTAASLSLQLAKTSPRHLEQVRRQLARLSRLEDSLLTLVRIDSGTLDLERSKVDVYTVLELAAENLEELFRQRQVTVSIPDRGRAHFTGDLEWTMEALMNLMKNCLDHSPPGGVIHGDYSQNPLYVEIRIWDEGEGFCPEDIPRLFERFYRGKGAVGDGIGVGLSLARSVFELQNGIVTASNLPGGGACFEIRVYCH